MKFYKYLCVAGILLSLSIAPVVFSASSTRTYYTEQQIAKILGWHISKNNPCNLCNGYYYIAPFFKNHPFPGPISKQTSYIHADGPTTFSEHNVSILQKNVIVKQPGRLIKADKAYIYRDKKTGKISRIHLVGHVVMHQDGKFILSDDAHLDIPNNTARFSYSLYHLNTGMLHDTKKFHINTKQRKHKQAYDAWGKAKKSWHLSNGVIKLEDSTYTTCPPISPTWHLWARHLTLDRKAGKGKATNLVLWLRHIPIFYWPYFSFPLDNRRKSGFLNPDFVYSNKNGYDLKLPIYWSMAPNYDATITPEYFSKRGLQMKGLFRYLSQDTHGKLFVSYLPDDSEFNVFKQQNDNINDYPTTARALYQPYVDDLQNHTNNRGYFLFDNTTKFGERWTANANLQYVTDSYYFRDFGDSYNLISSNQLLNQVDLNYNGIHWNMTGLVQAYQTLHLIDQASSVSYNQYRRLPEIDLSSSYPNLPYGLDFSSNFQYVYFDYDSKFTPLTFQLPVGQRLHIRPSISRPINFSSGYITPRLLLDNTAYFAKLQTTSTSITRPDYNADRVLPIVNIDSGLYTDRRFHFHHHTYIQTFEPRLFYLYVPYINQNQYPNFDTEILPFSFDQIFSVNRFSGFDRLDNANQLSLGITSRILDGDDANQLLKMDLGIIYYIQDPKVCLNNQTITTTPNGTVVLQRPDCGDNQIHDQVSPLVGRLTYYPSVNWSIDSSIAWAPYARGINNADVTATYSHDNRYIASVGYTYVHSIDGIPMDSLGLSNNTNLVHIGTTWPLGHKLSLFGYWYYNIAKRHSNSYYAGVQFDSCCWTVRLIAQRTFLGVSPGSTASSIHNEYNTSYYVQLQFKGLGGVGNRNPDGMLLSTLPGYHDPFNRSL